jgi:hypothetical protein
MKTINKIRLLLLFAIISISCEDVFEVDISNNFVEIISPIRESEIASNVVNFQWNNLRGAKKYRVQVYDENKSIILDSLVSNTKLKYPFSVGKYEWKVRAENSGYQSTYSSITLFHVIQSLDLRQQQVVLNKPIDNFFVNNGTLNFNWQSIDIADYYEIVITNETNNQTVVYQKSNLTNISESPDSSILSQDAKYTWKVRAVNSSSQTLFTTRVFSIDKVTPNQPVNSKPDNNSDQLINQPINFTWTSTDTGVIQSPLKYTIDFSNDNAFSTIIKTSDVTTTTSAQTFTIAGDYYWRVKTTDEAKNESSYSASSKFTIK